ncbi:MAG TPA: ABC transporter substrate-binding protein [Burkholderiaceae bacterium]|nr:ABC transporter substrate-binding protein [Burkholderiaceae bacterium]
MSNPIPHVSYLSQGSEANRGAFLAAFRDALRELGWVDGKNVVIDVYFAAPYELPSVAAAAARRGPAAMVGTCIPSTRAAKNASATIPVVMSVNGDPVEAGLVASLARPGANVTGTWTLFEQLVPKWLELITTVAPAARTVAVLVNPDSIEKEYWWARAEEAARQVRVHVVRAEAATAADVVDALAMAVERGADAMVVMVEALFLNQIARTVTLANLRRLPAIYGFREYAEAGGLMSYGLSYRNYYKNVARYVDKVLRGVKPADLPVEQPTQLELVINLKTAKALGITIPQSLLLRADGVIQ